MKIPPKESRIPIIVFTGRDSMTDEQKVMDLGASGFFRKLEHDSKMFEQLHKLLNDDDNPAEGC